MRKIYLSLVFVLFTFYITAQTVHPDFWDGKVFIKLLDEVEFKLPDYNSENSNIKDFDDFPELQRIIETYEFTELVMPFKTPCPRVQRIYRVHFDKHEDINFLLKELNGLNYIEYAEKSQIYRLLTVPNDAEISRQYALENIRAFDAWEIADYHYRPRLAIVDDAVRITHPDLADNIWVNPDEVEDGTDTDGNGFIDDIHGWNAANNNNNPNPPDNQPLFGGMTHGTHVAGIAGAVSNNEIGVAGVSNNQVSIIAVKCQPNPVFLPTGLTAAEEGVDYAIAANSDVINMSWGGADSVYNETLRIIIVAGQERGIIFVAAAGNSGHEQKFFPAAYQGVVAVGATRHDDEIAVYSQRGDFIDIMAPGDAIFSTLAFATQYGFDDGTSMASPLVAGAIAFLKSHRPNAENEEIINCLLMGCDNIYPQNPELEGKIGAGRLNLYNSVMCLSDFPVYSEENEIKNFSFYPNPANDKINLIFNSADNRTIKISSVTGQIALRKTLTNQYHSLNIESLSKGLYIISILEENTGVKQSERLVVY